MANIIEILNHNYKSTVTDVVAEWLTEQGSDPSTNLLPIGCEVCGTNTELITEVLSTARMLTAAGFPDGECGNLVVRLVNSDVLVLCASVPECAGEATAFGTWDSYNRYGSDEHCSCDWGSQD